MIFLPDVNVWIALTSNRHVHHFLARQWIDSIESDRIAFCRITELGFLRLLTNPHVMGLDVLSPAQAWNVYDHWRSDERVIFSSEPIDFSDVWRRQGEKIAGGPNVWTDAYLAVFALQSNATVVTLDRKFIAFDGVALKSLI
jgi:toxin-antitoxin system PIN domain toxin